MQMDFSKRWLRIVCSHPMSLLNDKEEKVKKYTDVIKCYIFIYLRRGKDWIEDAEL